jgi:hypothetical protein
MLFLATSALFANQYSCRARNCSVFPFHMAQEAHAYIMRCVAYSEL